MVSEPVNLLTGGGRRFSCRWTMTLRVKREDFHPKSVISWSNIGVKSEWVIDFAWTMLGWKPCSANQAANVALAAAVIQEACLSDRLYDYLRLMAALE